MSPLLFDEMEYQFFQISFSLPQKEKDVILKEKNNIMSKFGNLKRVKSIPHISICGIKVSTGKTESILTKITQQLQKISSFKVNLNGYDVFTSKLVYAKVESIDRFDIIWSMLESIKKETSYAHIIYSKTPHITLAIAKDNSQAEELKKEYELQTLDFTFPLKDLVIGQTNEFGEEWRLVRKFSLKDGIN
jgi:2'-5' RNA ligase